jgi:glutamate racemase
LTYLLAQGWSFAQSKAKRFVALSNDLNRGNRKIGVFDSGVGGLSVLREIRHACPYDSLIYLADSAFAPYGERSSEDIIARSCKLTDFLLTQKVDAVVIACNTASVHAASTLRQHHHLPIIAMEPAIKPAIQLSPTGNIAVLATKQTLLKACPGWVERFEAGELASQRSLDMVQTHLRALIDKGVDTIVLGCTHYPFLRPLIEDTVGNKVRIIDPAPAVAQELVRRLALLAKNRNDRASASNHEGQGDTSSALTPEVFYSTGSIIPAEALFSKLWGEAVKVRSPCLA